MDQNLLIWAQTIEHDWLTRWMRLATKLGDTSSWIIVGTLLLAGGATTRRYFWLVSVSALSAALFAKLLKHICQRPRPKATIPGFAARVTVPDLYSFPSGHTMTAFSVAVALLPAHPIAGAVALLHAANVGTSRVYLGAHYPLDVLVGAALGSSIGWFVHLLLL